MPCSNNGISREMNTTLASVAQQTKIYRRKGFTTPFSVLFRRFGCLPTRSVLFSDAGRTFASQVMLLGISVRDATTVTVIYGTSESAGIKSLVAAGALSGVAVICLLVVMLVRPPCYRNTHVIPIFLSLLFANILQAVASMMDARWIIDGAVKGGNFCSAQGGLKNGGNVAAALWSSVLSVHVFMLLFLRKGMTDTVCTAIVIVGWVLVGVVVAVGPLAIQTAARGDYFGVSGYWCASHSICGSHTGTVFVGAGSHTTIRRSRHLWNISSYGALISGPVRGNLTVANGKWRLRSGDLCSHVITDCSVKTTRHPVAYTVCLLPVTLARFISFGGREVPFWATVSSDFIFNLQGLVNVLLVLCTRHLIPNTSSLPMFTPRKVIEESSPEAYGITPYVLTKPPERDVEKALPEPPSDDNGISLSDNLDGDLARLSLSTTETRLSMATVDTVDSTVPLVQKLKWISFSFCRK
ncbi:hypothetical protein POSPLADRAFT_1065702 [Postia placenta MAD-698-R-SB12]|uniref:Glucose receptor Git3 N-terminal domain-containing protein n=1 Tax=Postia placenta MAD-698-R-SB12 TaxID=670580 RepID=A0A1X6N4J1_9APHY|nr:hypothetical protein POSPLADRAFT_1065702 [Postia placenta MAD-698-R-SB12]OSX63440.1 hypothetical protein POSPLADRAFT_1065702 [Postia placenta MAD-698-R-SB12]